MRNVLFISYYWPPAAGPGVQRAVKFVKYLQEFGYEPIVLTVKNNQQFGYDESLNKDIPKNIEVYSDFNSLQKNNKNGKSFVEMNSIKDTILIWLRANILIPDGKIFWYWQVRKNIALIFNTHKIDLCFVTAPPQTTHLIGFYVKKKYNIKVVHDFRDPWTDAFFLKEFPRTTFAQMIDKYLEKKILSNADAITSVSQQILNSLQTKIPNKKLNMLQIANGFDDDLKDTTDSLNGTIRHLVYTGTISQTYEAPLLFNYLKTNIHICLDIYGQVHSQFIAEISKYNLKDKITFNKVVDHDTILKIQNNADYLLLFIPNLADNKGILTGKLFEYFSSQKPILAFGPTDGEAAEILKNAQIGLMIDYNDPDGLAKIDLFFKTKWQINKDYIEQFHRKNLTKKLAQFFNDLFIN